MTEVITDAMGAANIHLASEHRIICASICSPQQAGIDQVIFLQQAGRNSHAHICEALELFASAIMPEFVAGRAEREEAREKELAPFIEAAMHRKQKMPPLLDAEIPVVKASAAKAQFNKTS